MISGKKKAKYFPRRPQRNDLVEPAHEINSSAHAVGAPIVPWIGDRKQAIADLPE
jgi:hypothetical protein